MNKKLDIQDSTSPYSLSNSPISDICEMKEVTSESD